MEATRPSEYHLDALCVILETLLVPQSQTTDLAPELISLGGALLTDSTQATRRNSYLADQNFFGGDLFPAKILNRIITCLRDSISQPNQTPQIQL